MDNLINLISRVHCYCCLHIDFVDFIFFCCFIPLELCLFLLLFKQSFSFHYDQNLIFFESKYYLVHVTIRIPFAFVPSQEKSFLLFFGLKNFCLIILLEIFIQFFVLIHQDLNQIDFNYLFSSSLFPNFLVLN